MEYSVSANEYLSRARAALCEGLPQGIFYAAFELRCCVETRQAEYAQALKKYENTKIRPWNIGDTGKRIRKASYAEKISLMRYDFGDGLLFDSYHTPVSASLITFAERSLGDLLHAQPIFRLQKDGWWKEKRDCLLMGYRMAWLACQGDSLVPPLWNPRTKVTHPVVMERHIRNERFFERMPVQKGTKFRVEVCYLDSPPEQWQCDL